jgi:hypothetical protein
MALLSVREYSRRRGITEAAVRKRLVTRGGPIPVHGRARQIDPDEADRLWHTTMSPAGASTSRFHGPPETEAAADASAAAAGVAFVGNMHALTQARTALLLTEAQLRRLRLEERRGALLDRRTTLAKFFTTVRAMRDAWLAWPARVGPEMAADLHGIVCADCRRKLDAPRLMIVVEPYVRRQLEELAGVRLDVGPGREPRAG